VQGQLEPVGSNWRVTLHVNPGTPVTITAVDLKLDATAAATPAIRRAQRTIENLKGQTLDHGVYDADRDALSGALTANGFLDARLVTHQVDVNRGERSAVVRLAWEAGPRYRFGQVHFEGSQFRPGFLQRYVPFKAGDYFAQDKLLQLQQALNGADYFAVVNVLPDVDDKKNGVVDVKVELTPAKRTVYTGGPFFGTDTGFGVRVGERPRPYMEKRAGACAEPQDALHALFHSHARPQPAQLQLRRHLPRFGH
jgi:translocation and assembly module TamA